jgi:hypothetical protein
LHPNGIPWHGPRKKGYIFLFILIWACCISNDFAVNLTIGTCIIQLHFQDFLGFFSFLCYLCSNLWFIVHALFLGTSIKTCWGANKHILVLEGDKSCLNLCWSQWLRIIHKISWFCPISSRNYKWLWSSWWWWHV